MSTNVKDPHRVVKKPYPRVEYCLCGCDETVYWCYYHVGHGPRVMQRVIDEQFNGDWREFVGLHGGDVSRGWSQVLKLASKHYGSVAYCGAIHLGIPKVKPPADAVISEEPIEHDA